MQKFKQHKEKIIGLIVSLVFIGLIFWNIDFDRLVDTFKTFDYKVIFAFIPLYVTSLYLRGYRWKCLLNDEKGLSTNKAFCVFTAGNTLNSYFPARAGDFWRAYHIGKHLHTSKVKVLGSIILERIIDGISILLILTYAVLSFCKQQWILDITYISAFLFIGALIFFYTLLKSNKTEIIFAKIRNIKLFSKLTPVIDKIDNIISHFMQGFQSLNNPKNFWLAFGASCLAWIIECLVTYILILGFGYHFGISIAMFVISFLALSTIIPSSSIFVGPYQYAYILALGIYNIDKSNGLGIAFIHQILIMLTITIITIIYFLLNKKNINEIRAEINTK